MSLDDRIFDYCERGQDPAFWAEPLNAVSNAAFIIAAVLATRAWLQAPPDRRGLFEALLIALTYAIGIGSFLFHTYATRWAIYADTIPIGAFMLAYVAYLLRRLVRGNWFLVGGGFGLFFVALRASKTVTCSQAALLPITAQEGARCLNGSVGYLPALAALAIATVWLAALGRRSWPLIGAATLVFLVSVTFRTLDIELCGLTQVAGHPRGTHFLWHTLNGVTLYLLLRAAIVYGDPPKD
jgi:hypothetical protein